MPDGMHSIRPKLSSPSLVDDAILAAVADLHFLTAQQVCRLQYSPGSLTYVRSRLKRLVDTGYLLAFPAPRPSIAGHSAWVYCLGHRGLRHLRGLGRDLGRRARPSEHRRHGDLFLLHTLAINDVLIAAQHLATAIDGCHLAAFRHERELKHTPMVVTTARNEQLSVIPDAWLDLRVHDREQVCVLLELDRGTEDQRPFRRKVRGLLAASHGAYQALFGTQSLTIAVATIAGPHRLHALRQWIEHELRSVHREAEGDLFRLTQLPDGALIGKDLFLSLCWSRPFDSRPAPLVPV